MELDVYKTDGMTTGEKFTLPEQVFNGKPNNHAVYQAIRSYMVNNRQGSASTKNRANVRGGGRKPWRQKGRGVARAGTNRSPLWPGGGRIFGPTPINYRMKLPKKIKRIAKISALAHKAHQNEIMIIEDFTLDNPKTKEIFGILKNINVASKKVLLVTSQLDKKILQAGRNIPNLIIRMADSLSTYDILNCQVMLLQKSSIEKIKEVCKL